MAIRTISVWIVRRGDACPNFVTGRKKPYFDAILTSPGVGVGAAVIGGDTNTGVPPLDGNPPLFTIGNGSGCINWPGLDGQMRFARCTVKRPHTLGTHLTRVMVTDSTKPT